MLFLLNGSATSYCAMHISYSLPPNPNNNNNHLNHRPTSLPIPNKSHSDVSIKAPTPPWMKGPLLLQPHELANTCHVAKHEPSDKSLTGKEVRGKKAMKKIAQRVQMLKGTRDSDETQMGSEKVENFGACLEGLKGENEEVGSSSNKERMSWEKDEKVVFLRVKREKHVTVADLTLDKVLLQGLRGEAARMRTWVKVKKAGVTQAVVDEIRRTWRTNELAMVKIDIPLCWNMDRAREIVEEGTKDFRA